MPFEGSQAPAKFAAFDYPVVPARSRRLTYEAVSDAIFLPLQFVANELLVKLSTPRNLFYRAVETVITVDEQGPGPNPPGVVVEAVLIVVAGASD